MAADTPSYQQEVRRIGRWRVGGRTERREVEGGRKEREKGGGEREGGRTEREGSWKDRCKPLRDGGRRRGRGKDPA